MIYFDDEKRKLRVYIQISITIFVDGEERNLRVNQILSFDIFRWRLNKLIISYVKTRMMLSPVA